MITLMLTTLGCLCSGAAEQQHISDAIEIMLASLRANEGESDGDATLPVPAAPACVQPSAEPNLSEWVEDACPDLAPDSDDEDYAASCPSMPCAAAIPTAHRDKSNRQGLYNACVARPVRPAELKTNEPARAAMQDEWDPRRGA